MTHLLDKHVKFLQSFAIFNPQNKSSSNNKAFFFWYFLADICSLVSFLWNFVFARIRRKRNYPTPFTSQKRSCIQQSKWISSTRFTRERKRERDESTLDILVDLKFNATACSLDSFRYKEPSINHEQTSHEKVNIPRVPDLKSAAGNVNSIKSPMPSKAHVPQQFLTLFLHTGISNATLTPSLRSEQTKRIISGLKICKVSSWRWCRDTFSCATRWLLRDGRRWIICSIKNMKMFKDRVENKSSPYKRLKLSSLLLSEWMEFITFKLLVANLNACLCLLMPSAVRWWLHPGWPPQWKLKCDNNKGASTTHNTRKCHRAGRLLSFWLSLTCHLAAAQRASGRKEKKAKEKRFSAERELQMKTWAIKVTSTVIIIYFLERAATRHSSVVCNCISANLISIISKLCAR